MSYMTKAVNMFVVIILKIKKWIILIDENNCDLCCDRCLLFKGNRFQFNILYYELMNGSTEEF